MMKTLKAFANAFSGARYFFLHERNGRIQLFLGILTMLFGALLKIDRYEWMIVLLCTGAVLSAEMLNSALEKVCDYIQPAFDLHIKLIKDLAAAAVLLISLISAITGAFIILPKIWNLL